MKPSPQQHAADTVRRLKRNTTPEQRLHGWQQTCTEQGLSGEFALAAKLGERGFDDEQAKMVAELFGR